MKLADLNTGTPIIMSVFDKDECVAEIWGKIRKNSEKETSIDIFCYKGQNVNFNAPQYHISAKVYQDGEHEISWENRKVGKGDADTVLVEQRDNFRIYIGDACECVTDGEETAVLLVDLSEGGFRVMSRTEFKPGSPISIMLETDDGELKMKGQIVWGKKVAPERFIYGCKMSEEQELTKIKAFLELKQKNLKEEFESSLAK